VKYSFGDSEKEKLDFKDDGSSFNQFTHNEKNFGYESTYKQSFYTTEVDESKYTEEQKRKASRLEREIGQKKYYSKKYNENGDEEMDVNKEVPAQNYDDFVKDNKVMTITELEEKQLSGKANGNQGKTEGLKKKESMKSDDDFILEGMKETVSEGSLEEEPVKTKLNTGSMAFVPKVVKNTDSSKSIDEFEIKAGKKEVKKLSILTSKSKVFIPKKKSNPVQPLKANAALSRTVNPLSMANNGNLNLKLYYIPSA